MPGRLPCGVVGTLLRPARSERQEWVCEESMSSAEQQKVKVPACWVRCLSVYGTLPDPARDVERRHCEHEQEAQAGGVRGRSIPHMNC